MQQTTKYKLNLIERDDVFSPAPLNENMEKVEAAISAEAAARQSADTAEAQARTNAVAAEAQARAAATNAEAQSRVAGDTAEAQARAAAVAALDQRIQVLEVHKFVTGYASGSDTELLGATPKAVLA